MSCFFYGTLMHPKVLQRVTDSDRHVYLPSILLDHKRCRVKGQDYPGVVPHQGHSVNGMLVLGLAPAELARLDLFEGDEYERAHVQVRTVSDGKSIPCQTYIYLDPSALDPREWDFADFEKEKLHRWTGEKGEAEYNMLSTTTATGAEDGTGGRSAFK